MATKKVGGSPKTKTEEIVIPDLTIVRHQVFVVGDEPIITHRFSEKAMKMMEEAQTAKSGEKKKKKDPKEPDVLYREAAYSLNNCYDEKNWGKGGFGIPAVAFKACCVRAVTSLPVKFTKEAAKQAFHIIGTHGSNGSKTGGDLVQIFGSVSKRRDSVRIPGTGDLRYRPQFWPWFAYFWVDLNIDVITPETLQRLLHTGGFAVGVGEWRVERGGNFGRFHQATAEEMDQIAKLLPEVVFTEPEPAPKPKVKLALA